MKRQIFGLALENAIEHDGRANFGSVMGKAMSTFPELKNDPKETAAIITKEVAKVNALDLPEQRRLLKEMGIKGKARKRRRGRTTEGGEIELPTLKKAEKGKVVLRFAPGPSGPLHIGHSRAAILNDYYARRYDGKFILRLEDTNPDKIDPDAYEMIREDLDWLGVEVHETVIQSDRFDIYYDICRSLISEGRAYVCTCDPEEWRRLKNNRTGCPHRELVVNDQLEMWDRMKEGEFGPGEASLMIKTDLEHSNPAVRDFVGIRIKNIEHPRTGGKYNLYPLYNLSVAIDDHLLGCTHVLRGKDHLNNTIRQKFVYRSMGWDIPEFIHYGLVSIPDSTLKTSTIKEALNEGKFTGWDDIRLGTLRALAARGFEPGSLRRFWIDMGVKPVDISFSWDNLYSINRQMIDGGSPRYFFVEDPVRFSFLCSEELTARAPLHPEHPEMGVRVHHFKPVDGSVELFISGGDSAKLKEGELIRLKDLANVTVKDPDRALGSFSGQDLAEVKNRKARIIHWAPPDGISCFAHYSDGSIRKGIAERGVKEAAERRTVVQFERVGYFRLMMKDGVAAMFTHK